MHKISIRVLLPVILLVSSSLANAASQMGTTAEKMPIHRSQDPSSEVIGTYPADFKVKYEKTADPAWVKILFSRPFKGANFGYARASALGEGRSGKAQVTSAPAGRSQGSSSSPSRLDKYRMIVGLGADMAMASPSAMLTALGESTGSVSVMQPRLKVLYPLSDKLVLYGHAGSEAFTHLSTTSVKTLYGSGFSGAAGAQYRAMKFGFMSAYVGGGLGSHLYSVSTEKSGLGATTSSIFGVNIEVPRLTLIFPVISSLALELNAGYQMKSLPQVTIVTGGTVQSPITSTADVNLGGPFFGGNLSWIF